MYWSLFKFCRYSIGWYSDPLPQDRHFSAFSYLGIVVPSGNLVNVSVGSSREVDGESVALAEPRRQGCHLKQKSCKYSRDLNTSILILETLSELVFNLFLLRAQACMKEKSLCTVVVGARGTETKSVMLFMP